MPIEKSSNVKAGAQQAKENAQTVKNIKIIVEQLLQNNRPPHQYSTTCFSSITALSIIDWWFCAYTYTYTHVPTSTSCYFMREFAWVFARVFAYMRLRWCCCIFVKMYPPHNHMIQWWADLYTRRLDNMPPMDKLGFLLVFRQDFFVLECGLILYLKILIIWILRSGHRYRPSQN